MTTKEKTSNVLLRAAAGGVGACMIADGLLKLPKAIETYETAQRIADEKYPLPKGPNSTYSDAITTIEAYSSNIEGLKRSGLAGEKLNALISPQELSALKSAVELKDTITLHNNEMAKNNAIAPFVSVAEAVLGVVILFTSLHTRARSKKR